MNTNPSRPTIQFLIHDKVDNVGVAVVDLSPGERAHGLYLETREPVEIEVQMPIPLGHKLALQDIPAGETLTKYGQDVGKFITGAKRGEHVHVHNVKTKRW